MDPTIFSLLPAEVVRLILDHSARDSSQAAARLLRVSKLVHTWVLPTFYETLVINVAARNDLQACNDIVSGWHTRFLNLQSRSPGYEDSSYVDKGLKDSKRYASSLKNICLTIPLNTAGIPIMASYSVVSALLALHITRDQLKDVRQLIRESKQIENLYIDVALDELGMRGPQGGGMHAMMTPISTSSWLSMGAFGLGTALGESLTHLHCGSWEAWISASRYLGLLMNLTHLRVDVAYNTGILGSFLPLLSKRKKVLPLLTHFAVALDSRSGRQELKGMADFVAGILRRREVVQVVLMAWFCWETTRTGVMDVLSVVENSEGRLGVIDMTGCADLGRSVKEWEDEARGKRCIWDEAIQV
ncbi:hypothetical protein M422DRAFT_34533 [Sphaerobolus stellatus SS14]|uniref:Uncharacterized protein n=1 Tax=Sphaerobolus stellatus (strain SS14) TaxID=990650 RepID=A0A0C9TZ61_SPHS4|nr:hypothetical protein M422DRAFT_34533 [Sphaerobolus stellatus SS14]